MGVKYTACCLLQVTLNLGPLAWARPLVVGTVRCLSAPLGAALSVYLCHHAGLSRAIAASRVRIERCTRTTPTAAHDMLRPQPPNAKITRSASSKSAPSIEIAGTHMRLTASRSGRAGASYPRQRASPAAPSSPAHIWRTRGTRGARCDSAASTSGNTAPWRPWWR